jgi:hypothetical protein
VAALPASIPVFRNDRRFTGRLIEPSDFCIALL